jgi:hypothetical protein
VNREPPFPLTPFGWPIQAFLGLEWATHLTQKFVAATDLDRRSHGPTQVDEKRPSPATALHGSFALPFVIPTEA